MAPACYNSGPLTGAGDRALFTRILILLILTCLALGARAERVVDLYSADTLVRTQSAAQRAAGAKRALAEALVRISGVADAAERPPVREALVRAEDFVYEYSYHSTEETLEDPSGVPVPASRLSFKFSPTLIEGLLREAGLPFWPANRPAVLVWMVSNTTEGMAVNSDGTAYRQLRQAAGQRGLPLITPLFDLEDYLALPAEALWRLDEPAIREASERYRPDAVLVVRFSELSSGEWRADWQLLHAEGVVSGDARAAERAALRAAAVGAVADHFAGLYAINPGESGSGQVALLVNNVEDFATYKAIEGYLQKLALVRRVELTRLSDNRLLLQVHTEVDIPRLENALALDGRLLPDETGSLPQNRYLPRGLAANPLRYQWREAGR